MILELVKLTRTDFDSMENIATEIITETKYFQSNDKSSAHGVASKYIDGKQIKIYLGWNGIIYPQFKLEKVYLEK